MRKLETKEIQKYWETSFQSLSSEELDKIIDYICNHQVTAPTLYRGINIDPQQIEKGDTLELHDQEAFASMSPDLKYAWAFGNVILKVEGLKGCPITEKEWLVLNDEVCVVEIEYDQPNDIYIVSCQ